MCREGSKVRRCSVCKGLTCLTQAQEDVKDRKGPVCELTEANCMGPNRAKPGSIFSPGKDPKDHEKENLRRIKEIQRRWREQEQGRERGQPHPLKALWRSPKYDKVESRVKALLQVPPSRSPVCLFGDLVGWVGQVLGNQGTPGSASGWGCGRFSQLAIAMLILSGKQGLAEGK